MKDMVTKCGLQAIFFAVVLMVINLVAGDIVPLPIQMPVRLPVDWVLTITAFLEYWCLSFFILFTIEALRSK